MHPAAMNIICENMPTQTANIRTYEHGLPEHEYYCKRIAELEAELVDERASRKAEHSDIVRGHKVALARAERAEIRVKVFFEYLDMLSVTPPQMTRLVNEIRAEARVRNKA